MISKDCPLIGVEPSTILTFRDEALELLRGEALELREQMAPHCLTFEEFIAREHLASRITSDAFTSEPKSMRLHGHCFQKALTGQGATVTALSIPSNYSVKAIPSGCCGMAGSFGYEAEHYELSMQIAELVLLPAVRAHGDECIVAPGTSCRHQIHDGVGVTAMHPAEVLHEALAD